MSWSISLIGKPENVAAELDKFNAGNEQSQAEFDAAKPHLQALLRENFVTEEGAAKGYSLPTIEFSASGSGTAVNGQPVSGNCAVSIQPKWTKLV